MMRLGSNKYRLVILGVGIVALAFYYLLSNTQLSKTNDSATASSTSLVFHQGSEGNGTSGANVIEEPKPIDAHTVPVKDFLKNEATLVGKIDSDPNASERKIIDYAQTLAPSDFAYLKDSALDTKQSGDERFLSVYILTKAAISNVTEELSAIANAPMPNGKIDGRIYDQEVLIRAQALEGLASNKNKSLAENQLRQYIAKQNDVSLIAHAKRLLEEIKRRSKI